MDCFRYAQYTMHMKRGGSGEQKWNAMIAVYCFVIVFGLNSFVWSSIE